MTRVLRQENDPVLGVVTDMNMMGTKDALLTNSDTKAVMRG